MISLIFFISNEAFKDFTRKPGSWEVLGGPGRAWGGPREVMGGHRGSWEGISIPGIPRFHILGFYKISVEFYEVLRLLRASQEVLGGPRTS